MPSIISWTIILSIGVTAISVWGLLTFAARRSLLDTMSRRHFGVTSGTFLFGWLVLACILGGSGLFQATPTRAFPALALGIVLLIVTGALLMSRSLSLKTVMEAIPLPWLVGVQLYRVLGFNFLLLSSLGRLPGEFALPAGWGDVMVGLPLLASATCSIKVTDGPVWRHWAGMSSGSSISSWRWPWDFSRLQDHSKHWLWRTLIC